jgi:hypothetical protein
MREVIFAFACAESCNQFSDPSAEIGNGSFSGLAQKCFQFAEGLFDWIEIGRIFRQLSNRARAVLMTFSTATPLWAGRLSMTFSSAWMQRASWKS